MSGRWDPLIASYRPGRSLEGAFYTDPELFREDMERVFLRHWLFVGHASRLPRPGDYFLYEVAGESVILVRGRDGGINALLNVCAHRGSRVCLEPAGHAARLVCPYHAWCYDLDGSLAAARNMPEGFERADYGLRRLAVEVVEDLIHICIAAQPPDFSPVTADVRKFFTPHGWTRAKVAAREAVVIRANWKAVAENFLECYHCPPTHPELNQVMSYVRAYDSPRHAEERRQLIERWDRQAREMGHVTGSHKSAEGVCHTVTRIPIREGFLTQSREGRAVAPLMGELKAYDGGVTAMQFFPVHWFVANNDYGMLARFTPLSVQETEAELTWLVDRDAREGTDYAVENITWLWQSTMREDVAITENNQAGINSRYYRPGPHSRDESLDEFYRWYLRCLAS